MKRIMVLLAATAMMVATMALSGVALARPIGDSADAKCFALAIRTLGPSVNPANYTFIGGTEGVDDFSLEGTDGPDVFCGFGGDDRISVGFGLAEGDIFLGGEGNDYVAANEGTFYGGPGNDSVDYQGPTGTFYGEEGYDYVGSNAYGTVYGGADNDYVVSNDGTFYGGTGNDTVEYNMNLVYAGAGDDYVYYNYGTFYGEEGFDQYGENYYDFIQ